MLYGMALGLMGCVDYGAPISSDVRIDGLGAPDEIDSRAPQMCVATDGTAYILWVDERSGTSDIWLNRRLPGGRLEENWLPTPVRVNQFADSRVENPDLACDAEGRVYVVWEDDRDGEVESHQIYAQVSTDGGATWRSEDARLELDPDGLTNSIGPRIAVDGARAYVVWADDRNGAFDIYFTQSFNEGVEWADPQRVNSNEPAGSSWSAAPEMVVGEGGQVFVTWQDTRDGGSDIRFARSVDGGLSFTPDVRLDVGSARGESDSFVPQIAASGPHVYVTWHDTRDGEPDIYVAYSSDGGASFEPDVRLDSTDGAGFSASLYPQLCIDGEDAHIAWEDRRDGMRVFYARVSAGLPSADIQIDDQKFTDSVPSVEPRIACGLRTPPVVSWSDDLGDAHELRYDHRLGTGWTSNNELRVDSSDGLGRRGEVELVVIDGSIYAAWSDRRNGSDDIFFQQFWPGAEYGDLRVFDRDAERE